VALRQMQDQYMPGDGISAVYFIRGKSTRRIKVGYTSQNPYSRMRDHQIGSPDHLELLGVINAPPWFEHEMHSVLKPYHSHGEWFDSSSHLLKFIKQYAYQPSRALSPGITSS
jgi:hypothetical protein